MHAQKIYQDFEAGLLTPDSLTPSNFQDIIMTLLDHGNMSEFFDMTSANEYPYGPIFDAQKRRMTGLEQKIHALYNERASINALKGANSK